MWAKGEYAACPFPQKHKWHIPQISFQYCGRFFFLLQGKKLRILNMAWKCCFSTLYLFLTRNLWKKEVVDFFSWLKIYSKKKFEVFVRLRISSKSLFFFVFNALCFVCQLATKKTFWFLFRPACVVCFPIILLQCFLRKERSTVLFLLPKSFVNLF